MYVFPTLQSAQAYEMNLTIQYMHVPCVGIGMNEWMNARQVTWPSDGMHVVNDLTPEEIAKYLGESGAGASANHRVVIANVLEGGHFVLVQVSVGVMYTRTHLRLIDVELKASTVVHAGIAIVIFVERLTIPFVLLGLDGNELVNGRLLVAKTAAARTPPCLFTTVGLIVGCTASMRSLDGAFST